MVASTVFARPPPFPSGRRRCVAGFHNYAVYYKEMASLACRKRGGSLVFSMLRAAMAIIKVSCLNTGGRAVSTALSRSGAITDAHARQMMLIWPKDTRMI